MPQSIFRIIPLPSSIAERARECARAEALAHAAVITDSPRTFPCRHCLRWAEVGERVILFPYIAIPEDRPYTETGPIFVHEAPCERYASDEYPGVFWTGRVLRAYDSKQNMIDTAIVDDAEPEAAIERLFANRAIAFLHARSLTNGCYTFRIERK